jgi:hypothetical protein
MTDTGYTAQTSHLGSTAPQYDFVAQQVKQVYATLVTSLENEGACWGSDEQGQTFGAKYCGPAVSLLDQMSYTNQGIQSMVDSICVWAKNYMNADKAVADSASKLGSG